MLAIVKVPCSARCLVQHLSITEPFDSDGREPHVLPPPSARGAAGGRVRGLHRKIPEPHRASGAAPSAPRGPDSTPPVPLGRRRHRRRAHRRPSGGQPRGCGRSPPDGRVDGPPLRARRAHGRRDSAQPPSRSGRNHPRGRSWRVASCSSRRPWIQCPLATLPGAPPIRAAGSVRHRPRRRRVTGRAIRPPPDRFPAPAERRSRMRSPGDRDSVCGRGFPPVRAR